MSKITCDCPNCGASLESSDDVTKPDGTRWFVCNVCQNEMPVAEFELVYEPLD